MSSYPPPMEQPPQEAAVVALSSSSSSSSSSHTAAAVGSLSSSHGTGGGGTTTTGGSSSSHSGSSNKLGKIFIGGLSYETTDEKLKEYFSSYGIVNDAVVMKDPISRRSRGFGFITYQDPEAVDRALAQPNHVLDSRRVEAKRAVPRTDNGSSSSRDVNNQSGSSILSSSNVSSGNSNSAGNSNTSSSVNTHPNNGSSFQTVVNGNHRNNSNSGTSSSASVSSSGNNSVSGIATKKIFVGGLHYETQDAEFKKYFEQYGKVTSAEVMFNRETSKSRGFGFVVFEVESSVDQVLQNRNHSIGGKSVEVKRAVPRTEAPPSSRTSSTSTRGNSFSGPASNNNTSSVSSSSNTATRSASLGNAVQLLKSAEAKSFASITANNSSFKGYAAAVRYGGRLPPSPVAATVFPPGSSGGTPVLEAVNDTGSTTENSSTTGSILAEGFQKVSFDDSPLIQRLDSVSQSSSNGGFFENGSNALLPSSIMTSPGSFISHSPQISNISPVMSSSSQPSGPLVDVGSNSQWSTDSASLGSGHYQSNSPAFSVQQPSQGQSSFQWNQKSQWQNWPQSNGLGTPPRNSQYADHTRQQHLSQPPNDHYDHHQLQSQQHPQQQQHQQIGQQQQSNFFSMFGPPKSPSFDKQQKQRHGHQQQHQQQLSQDYQSWNGHYNSNLGSSSGLGGMGGSMNLGMGSGSIGLGMDNLSSGMGSLMLQNQNMNSYGSGSTSGFGGGSLSMLHHPNNDGFSGPMTSGSIGSLGGVDSGSNLDHQQQQSVDYGNTYPMNMNSQQFQGYQ